MVNSGMWMWPQKAMISDKRVHVEEGGIKKHQSSSCNWEKPTDCLNFIECVSGRKGYLSLGSHIPLVKGCLAECELSHISWHLCMPECWMVPRGPQTSVSTKLQQEERHYTTWAWVEPMSGYSLRGHQRESRITAMSRLWDEAGRKHHCAQEASSIQVCHGVPYKAELLSSFPTNEISLLCILLLSLWVLN